MSASSVAHSSAAAASLVARVGKGRVTKIIGYNAKGSAQFIQLHDAAAVPSDVVAGVAEHSTIDSTGGTPAGLDGTHFLLSGASGDFYAWFNLDAGSVDPEVAGRTGIEIAISTGDGEDDIATAIASALDAVADFGATASTNLVTIIDAATGARTDIAAGDCGLAVAVTQQGVTAIAAAVPIAVITAPTVGNFEIPLPADGIECQDGVVVCNSSAYATKVAGSADCFFTVVVI